jgi:hypothetical protein
VVAVPVAAVVAIVIVVAILNAAKIIVNGFVGIAAIVVGDTNLLLC